MSTIKHETFARVKYSDTDQMGFMHHSNYPRYYENARWEFFRDMDIPYSEIEESGILMPVIDVAFRYIKPAYYDEELRIVTNVSIKRAVKMKFEYQMFNSKNELINEGHVTTGFVTKGSLRPCQPPISISEAFERYHSQHQ
jgi:acyl-CoA thioester hydrolase